MKKVLTISIAAYNIEKYIRTAVESLIIDNLDMLDIIIVDDGSKDETLKIAKEYEQKYPNVIRVIHKENGGYGSTINTAIEYAEGKYFKQLDGDDLYQTENLNRICLELQNIDTDVVYTPYIIFNEKKNTSTIAKSDILLDLHEENLNKAIKNAFSKRIPMHSLMYKTNLLKKNQIKLQEKCYYTDTEYAIYPFFFATTIKIFDIPLYIYKIGREDQSMSKKNKIKNYNDILKVNYNLLNKSKHLNELDGNIKTYIENYIVACLIISIREYLILLKPNKENFMLIKKYNDTIKENSISLYTEIGKRSRLIRMLRKNNFFLYKVCYYLKSS